jgi:hypothetical protein
VWHGRCLLKTLTLLIACCDQQEDLVSEVICRGGLRLTVRRSIGPRAECCELNVMFSNFSPSFVRNVGYWLLTEGSKYEGIHSIKTKLSYEENTNQDQIYGDASNERRFRSIYPCRSHRGNILTNVAGVVVLSLRSNPIQHDSTAQTAPPRCAHVRLNEDILFLGPAIRGSGRWDLIPAVRWQWWLWWRSSQTGLRLRRNYE